MSVDYASFPVPEHNNYPEYSSIERKSQIYRWIEDAGHPRNLSRSQAQIGEQFGVSQQQISQDIEKLKEYEANRVGDDADATTQFVTQKAVRELMQEEKYQKAAKLQFEYYNWLFETGRREKEPDRHEFDLESAWKEHARD